MRHIPAYVEQMYNLVLEIEYQDIVERQVRWKGSMFNNLRLAL